MTNLQNRKSQTFALIILTAMTLMPSYALQGVMASGHDATELPWLFWIAEYSAWALRALIEAASLMFIFETVPNNDTQKNVLLFFKFALICLISLTLAPVIFAKGLNQNTPQVLNVTASWLWSFGVATYAPLMLASVGTAYAIMPDSAQSPHVVNVTDMVMAKFDSLASIVENLQSASENSTNALNKKLDTMQNNTNAIIAIVDSLQADFDKNSTDVLNAKLDAMAGIIGALQAKLDTMPKPQNEVDGKAARQAQIVAMRAQGVANPTELAQALGVSAMTVRRDLAELGISNGHANGHNGHTKLI
jgi:hypothetical protein